MPGMPKEHLDRVKRYKCKVNRGTRISISAVLPTFGRHRECALIKQNLIESGLFREVIIWINTSKHNAMLYGRYLASALAAYDVIYTQDDDCVVNNLPELIKLFDGERLIYNVKLPASVRYKRTY